MGIMALMWGSCATTVHVKGHHVKDTMEHFSSSLDVASVAISVLAFWRHHRSPVQLLKMLDGAVTG